MKWYSNNCGHYTSLGFAGSRARPYDMVTGAFPSCFLTCIAGVTVACVRGRGRQQMDGEHSQMINSSQSAWIELPALVCFPLLLFSKSVLYHIVMVALLGLLPFSSLHWVIVPTAGLSNSGLHGSAVGGETPAASSVIEFQTSSAGGDDEGTEITSPHVGWRGREGLGKLAVLFARKLNSPYLLESVLEKK